MASFILSQIDYVLFCYGLALLLLAVASFAIARRAPSPLPWSWLGLFGALRGAHEWLELLSYTTGPNTGVDAANAALVLVSGLSLVEFGRCGLAELRPGAPRRFILLPIAAVSLLGLAEGLKGFKSASNLTTGLVGGMLSAYAMMLFSRMLERASRRYVALAAAGMAAFSLTSGILSAHTGLSLGTLVNREVFLGLTGIPVQMVSGLLAALTAGALMAFFHAPFAAGRKIFLAPAYILVLVLCIGLFAAWMFGRSAEKQNLQSLLRRTQSIASALDTKDVAMLTGTRADLQNPSYRLLRHQFIDIHDINNDTRYLYLMGMKDGKLVFLVDAEPDGSKDFSFPGDVYTDAQPRDFADYRAGRSAVYPPYKDSWGTWVSGVSPVLEPETGRILAQVGLDVDASAWLRNIALHRLLIIAITAVICLVMVYAHLSWLKVEQVREQQLKENNESEKAILERERFLDNVFRSIQDGIAVVDGDRKIVRTNPAMEQWFSRNMPLVGKKCHEAFQDSPGPCRNCPLLQTLQTGVAASIEVEGRSEGEARCLEHFTYPMADKQYGGLAGAIGYFRDITQRKNAELLVKEHQAQLEELAHHDTLTGLPNRALFNDRLDQALRQAKRHKQTASVIFIDLDDFKTINDTSGHDAGDRLLKAAAERFKACVRDEDTIARLGGDEFAVILPQVDGIQVSCRIAQRLLDSLRDPFEVSGRAYHTGMSMGIAFFPGDGRDPKTLLSSADIALYRAKEAGGNNFQIFTAEMDKMVRERAELETALREAVERNEFVVHYQPQVDLSTGRTVCMEALVRWDRPGEGLVPPDRFIPVAEDTRLILPLGAWVLKEACRRCAGWDRDIRVAVNISARQFQQGELEQVVETALKETGLEAGRLELEITESAIMRDVESAATALGRLDAMGVHITIDDFGIGYSSFSYIKKFPIHTLKIDRTFVCNVTIDKNDAAISTAIVAMAHALHMQVVAEGIETGRQLEFLSCIGCDLGQGNLISRPLEVGDAGRFLKGQGRPLVA